MDGQLPPMAAVVDRWVLTVGAAERLPTAAGAAVVAPAALVGAASPAAEVEVTLPRRAVAEVTAVVVATVAVKSHGF